MPRKQKGGFFESLWNQVKTGTDSFIQQAKKETGELIDKTKRGTTSLASGMSSPISSAPPFSSSAPPISSSAPPSSTSLSNPFAQNPTGGRKMKRSKRRTHRGGFSANTARSLASNAESISGYKTAQPHNWVGGKTRRRRRHSKSRKH